MNENDKKFEEASFVYLMSKSEGWNIINQWIEARIKEAEKNMESFDPKISLEMNYINYLINLSEKQSFKKLLNKINEYVNFYLKGGIK